MNIRIDLTNVVHKPVQLPPKRRRKTRPVKRKRLPDARSGR